MPTPSHLPGQSDLSKVFQADDIFTLPVKISNLAKPEVTHGYLQPGWSDRRQKIGKVSGLLRLRTSIEQ
jgi:hypothetical protein